MGLWAYKPVGHKAFGLMGSWARSSARPGDHGLRRANVPARTRRAWYASAFAVDWRAGMLRHPWSALLLPRRTLGPNILGRLELLSRTLSGAGVADADLNVALWSLWNYVIGATVTRAGFGVSDDERTAAQQRLADQSERYPTITRSRLLLDNVDHIKAYWVSSGVEVAQTALWFGADDLDGTVQEETIYHMAGSTTPAALSTMDIERLIRGAGRVPVERDTLYNVVRMPVAV